MHLQSVMRRSFDEIHAPAVRCCNPRAPIIHGASPSTQASPAMTCSRVADVGWPRLFQPGGTRIRGVFHHAIGRASPGFFECGASNLATDYDEQICVPTFWRTGATLPGRKPYAARGNTHRIPIAALGLRRGGFVWRYTFCCASPSSFVILNSSFCIPDSVPVPFFRSAQRLRLRGRPM